MARRILVALSVSLAVAAAVSACGGSDSGSGVDLTCGAGEAPCGSKCVDIARDVANCGACGSVCTGQCNAGVCYAARCVLVNGVFWCYDPNNCGQACNTVCANLGLPFTISDADWLAAQNTLAKCQAISNAFGLAGAPYLSTNVYGCIEDAPGTHVAPGGLIDHLLCSTSAACPANHRTTMDQNGVGCGPGSRRSVCPCQ